MAPLEDRLGRVGLWVSPVAVGGPAGAAPFGRRVEALGVRAVWVGGGSPDAAAFRERAEMLAGTDHLVVATGIVNIWAWDPAALHAEATALERAYPGRFVLGLGVSHRPQVEKLGRQYGRPLAAMEAFLDELDRLDGAGGDPAPPRALAALGPRMLAVARDRSAGAHPYLVTPDHTAFARRVLGDGPLLAPEQAVVVGADVAAARGIAREYLATYLRLPNYLSNLGRFGFADEDFADGGSDRLVDAVVPSGTAEMVAARIREHFDAGADHVCIQPLAEARKADLEGFATLQNALPGPPA